MKKPKPEPEELTPTQKAILERWRRGPTHFLKDGNRWWEVYYRCRPRGTDDSWTEGHIGKVCKTAVEAGRHVQQKISQGHQMQVEILRVVDGGDERPIETGKPVKTVTEKEFAEVVQKRDEQLAEHQEELDDELYLRTKPTAWGLPSKTNGETH